MTPEELKYIRDELGLSQARLAEKIGVPVRAIKWWEGGQRKIPLYMAIMIDLVHMVHEAQVYLGISKVRDEDEND